MRAAVVTFPGSNCDDDAFFTLSRTCEWKTERLWHKDQPDLSGYDLVVLPGGFSYGDYLRCGAIASVSPIMDAVRAHAKRGGRVLGICNGFQILCESGLLPGALARNEKLQFVCRDVGLKVESIDSPWTCAAKAGQVLSFPIAHGDGRFVISAEDHARLLDNGQVLLTYAPLPGQGTEGNPNGSSFGIAGVCNAEKNVFGLMPHPERATDLRSRDGMTIWRSVRQAAEGK